VESLFTHIYQIAIGRFFMPATLGFFDRGRSLKDLAVQSVISPSARVFFPALASIKNDKDRIRKGFYKAIAALACCIFPALFGLAASAGNLLPFLYSDKWIPAVPYLQLLCPIGLFFALRTLHNNLYKAMGRPDLILKIQLFRVVLTIISILVTYRWGLNIMLLGEICCAGVTYSLTMIMTNRLIGYTVYRQTLDLIPYLVASAIMAIIVFSLGKLNYPSRFLLFSAQLCTGAAIYFFICFFTKPYGYQEVRKMISQSFLRLKPTTFS
jgi:O-antigen/teichoic acid export membrane protein